MGTKTIPLGESFLNSEAVNTFNEQGYFILRGAFKDQVPLMEQIVEKVVRTVKKTLASDNYPISGELPEITEINKSTVAYRKVSKDSISIHRVVGCPGIVPESLPIFESPRMLATFFKLLKTEELESLIRQCHPKEVEDGVGFSLHCDRQYRLLLDSNFPKETGKGCHYAVCIVAVKAMSKENGGLMLDTNRYPCEKDDHKNERIPEAGEEGIIAVDLEPGDIALLHPKIPHWSLPNKGRQPRYTLLAGYCAYGANSKCYPGSGINDKFSLKGDHIEVAPCSWKKMNEVQMHSGHH